MFGGGDGDSQPDYTGDDYYVTYHSGIPDVNSTYNEDSAGKDSSGNRVEKTVTVKYDGVAVAEYNPQFWNGSIAVVNDSNGNYVSGHATKILGSDENWYKPRSYVEANTYVFTGWKIFDSNDEGVIDPGDRLSLSPGEENTLHLVATWSIVKQVEFLSSQNCSETLVKPTGDGSKYTRVALVKGTISFSDSNSDRAKVGGWTIRGEDSNSVLGVTTGTNVATESAIGAVDCSLFLNGETIIDNIKLVGYDRAVGLGDPPSLYACGNKLIIGTGVTGDGNGPRQVQITGGNYGDSSSGTGEVPSTSVAIFSGVYSNIVAGSYKTSVGTTDLRIIGGEYIGTIYGGNSGYMGDDGRKVVDSVNVLVVGGKNLVSNEIDWQVVMGGSRGGSHGETPKEGSVKKSCVEITGNAHMKDVQAGGRSGDSWTKEVDVIVSGNAVVSGNVSGGDSDGNDYSSHHPVGTVRIKICGGATVGSVYGGGLETYHEPVGPGVKNASIEIAEKCMVSGSVFGGGIRGTVGSGSGDAISIMISGGTIEGNVYGGGSGSPDTKNKDRSLTGKGYILGNVNVTIHDGTIKGNVYGGGKGVDIVKIFENPNLNAGVKVVFKSLDVKDGKGVPVYLDVATVTGDVSVEVLGGTIEGNVFGAGKGFPKSNVQNTSKWTSELNGKDLSMVASVKGEVTMDISGGIIGGSVYGAGENGKLENGRFVKEESGEIGIDEYKYTFYPSNPKTATINIGPVTINGNVYGGGLGSPGVLSTYLTDRTININGATIRGSVYGGSQEGYDNCRDPDLTGTVENLFQETSAYPTCEINIISGNIATGTSGNVYGGGYAGHAYYNSTINIGEFAAGGTTVPSGSEVHILSVFGGPNVGVRDQGQPTAPELMKGNATVRINGERYTQGSFTITGDIFGGGDFCDVDGICTVDIRNFDQGEKKVQSIQKANSVTITDSKIRLSGNVDGSSLDGSNRMSLNRIGMLTLNFEHSRTEIELDYAARSVSGYYSLYHGSPLSADDTDVSKYNLIKMNNGKTFFIFGENENGKVEGIHGNTLFQSDDNSYYGAFVVGDLSGTVDASFWIVKDNKYEPATTTDYKRYSDSSNNDTRAWYISGSFRVEKVVVFDNGKGGQESKLDYVLPKISTESGIWYMGHHLELNSPGSMGLVRSLGSGQDSDVCLKFGVKPEELRRDGYLTFNNEQGAILIDEVASGSIRSDDKSSGLNMMMSVSMNPTKTMSGYIGSVVIHFAEMMDYKDNEGKVVSTVALGIFDVKVSVYVKSSASISTLIEEDVVMRETTDSTWTGTANVYLPALDDSKVGYYKILSISKSGTLSESVNGSLTIRSVSNEEGKDGWIDANHREALLLGSFLKNSVELGTGAVYSPVLEVTYTTQPDGIVFDNVYLTIEVRDDGGNTQQTVTVHLEPEKVADYTVTFYDKVLGGNGSWYTHNGDGNDQGKVFRELFSIDVEFGKTVRDYYVAYKVPSWSGGTRPYDAWNYLGTIEGCLMSDQVDDGSGVKVSKVLVSTDCQTMVSKAASQSVGGVVYTVGTVEDFLNEIIGNKPMTDFKLSDDQTDPYHYVYKDNNPSWNNGTAGLSRFNFERPITQNQVVYSGYGVEVTLKAIVKGEVRTGLVMPGVIIPVPDGDSGGVTIDAGVLGKHVTVREGYEKVLDDNGIWKWHQNTPDGAIVNKDTPIYSSVTVFVELELKTFHLTVNVSKESENGDETVKYSVSGKDVVSSDDRYGFNVESSDLKVEVTVVPNGENYHVVDVKGPDRYTVDGMTVHITPQAKNLDVNITVGIRYEVRVDLPSDGHSDNRLFGFDGPDELVAEGRSSKQVFLVDGTGTLSLKVPSAYAYYGDDRQLTFTLYDGSNNKVYPIPAGGDGQSATVPNVGIGNGTMTISGMTGAGTFHLYIQVEWEIKVQGEPGFTYSVQHLSDPLGSEYTSSEGNVVRTGDNVALTLKDGYTFDSTFVHSCAEWDGNESNNSRVYTVLGGGDVVFGKAVLLENGMIVFRFLGDDGSSPLGSFRIYGCARLTSGSVVTDILSGGGTTDSQGRLTFALTGVEPGQEFTVSAGFGGFRLVGKSVTEGDGAVTDYTIAVGNSFTTWIFDLTPCDMTVQFRDGDTLLHEEKAWNVKSSKNVGEIYTDADDYWMWSYGTGLFAKNGEPLDIGMFPQPADGFYMNDEELVLNAVPYLKDMTPAEYRESVTVILVIGGLNGQHVLNKVVPEIDGTLSVGGSSVDVVTDTNGGSPVLIIRGCPDGTGALQVITEKLVVLIVSVPEFEDVS